MYKILGRAALGACLTILSFALLLSAVPAKAKVLPPGQLPQFLQ